MSVDSVLSEKQILDERQSESANSEGSKPDETNNKDDLEKKIVNLENDPDFDGGYGWVIVFATFLLLFSTWGLNSAFGIYFADYSIRGEFKGATTLDYAFVGGISFGVGISCYPVITYIQGIVGLRAILIAGALIQFVGLMLASFCTKLWQLYLTQGLMQSFGLAMVGLPCLPLVGQWFRRKISIASSLATTGSGVGGVVFIIGMQGLTDKHGAKWALRASAIISTVLIFIAAVLVRTRTKQHNIKFNLYDKKLLKDIGFWLYCFYGVTCMFGYSIVLYTIEDLAQTLGYSPMKGAVVTAMVSLSFIYGRPAAGFTAHYIGPVTTTAISYYLAAVFILAMLLPEPNFATLIAFGLCEGLFVSTIFPTVAASLVQIGGISRINISFSNSWAFVGIAALFGQPICTALARYNLTGSAVYQHSVIFAGVSFIAAATSSLILRGYLIARKISKEESEEIYDDVLDIPVPYSKILPSCFKSLNHMV